MILAISWRANGSVSQDTPGFIVLILARKVHLAVDAWENVLARTMHNVITLVENADALEAGWAQIAHNLVHPEHLGQIAQDRLVQKIYEFLITFQIHHKNEVSNQKLSYFVSVLVLLSQQRNV